MPNQPKRTANGGWQLRIMVPKTLREAGFLEVRTSSAAREALAAKRRLMPGQQVFMQVPAS